MPSDLDNVIARRSSILAELANFPAGKVSYNIDGQQEDWNGYRRSLLNELTGLNKMIDVLQGPLEIEVRGTT